MTHNFVQQIASIERELQAVLNSTANYWQDDVKERFYNSYMNEYENKLEVFINGGVGNYGMGLEELLTFLDQKEREMDMLGRF